MFEWKLYIVLELYMLILNKLLFTLILIIQVLTKTDIIYI